MSKPTESMQYDIIGTHYPYINMKSNLFNPLLTNIRRQIAEINPFSLRQIPSEDRMAFGPRWGNQFYIPMVYPNRISFSRMFPTHYDPLTDDQVQEISFQQSQPPPTSYSTYAISADKLPRPCIRQIQFYKRCLMCNDNNAQLCQQEQQNIINICPNWALDEMKEKTRFLAKVQGINNSIYKEAMEISDYNKNRSVVDVPQKTWLHGTRKYLRPDTMYADERYAKITQKEINEAKKRIEQRKNQRQALQKDKHAQHTDEHKKQHSDENALPFKHEKPLYP